MFPLLLTLLFAAGLALLPPYYHNRGGPGLSRTAALASIGKSDWKRPFLERFWLLTYACTLGAFIAIVSASSLYRQGANGLASLCLAIGILFILAASWLTSLPAYTVVAATRRARDAKEARGRDRR